MGIKINSKKAQIGTTITWVVAFIIILFLMVGFLVITMVLSGKNKNEINFEGVENLDSQRELMKILNSPVEVNGESMNVRELINLTFFDTQMGTSEEKYEDVLKSEVKKVLDDFEYEYVDFQIKNLRVRGFSLLIYSEKHVKGEFPKELIRIPSERFKIGPCVSDVQGCKDLAGVYVPISDSAMVYIVLWASEGAK